MKEDNAFKEKLKPANFSVLQKRIKQFLDICGNSIQASIFSVGGSNDRASSTRRCIVNFCSALLTKEYQMGL